MNLSPINSRNIIILQQNHCRLSAHFKFRRSSDIVPHVSANNPIVIVHGIIKFKHLHVCSIHVKPFFHKFHILILQKSLTSSEVRHDDVCSTVHWWLWTRHMLLTSAVAKGNQLIDCCALNLKLLSLWINRSLEIFVFFKLVF